MHGSLSGPDYIYTVTQLPTLCLWSLYREISLHIDAFAKGFGAVFLEIVECWFYAILVTLNPVTLLVLLSRKNWFSFTGFTTFAPFTKNSDKWVVFKVVEGPRIIADLLSRLRLVPDVLVLRLYCLVHFWILLCWWLVTCGGRYLRH